MTLMPSGRAGRARSQELTVLFHVTSKAQYGKEIRINSRAYLIGDNGVLEIRHPDDVEKAQRMPQVFREIGPNEAMPAAAGDAARPTPQSMLAEKFVAVILGSVKMREFFRSLSPSEVTEEAKRMGYDVPEASIGLAVRKWVRTHPAEAAAMGIGEPPAEAPRVGGAVEQPVEPKAVEPKVWKVPEDGNWPDPSADMPREFLVQMAQAYDVMPGDAPVNELVANAPPVAGLVASIHAAMYSEASDTGAAAPSVSATPEASAPTGKKAGKGKKNKG